MQRCRRDKRSWRRGTHRLKQTNLHQRRQRALLERAPQQRQAGRPKRFGNKAGASVCVPLSVNACVCGCDPGQSACSICSIGTRASCLTLAPCSCPCRFASFSFHNDYSARPDFLARIHMQLRKELAAVKQELNALEKENKRMASAHDAFVRDHRKRLEKVCHYSLLLVVSGQR